MRAVLFDLGNTLVSYYAAADFAPILRECVRGCVREIGADAGVDEAELFRRALTLNVERPDHAVWPLADRLSILFGQESLDFETQELLTDAFLQPIFATAVVDPEALSTLASLRAQGFATAIVSNTPWGSPAPAWRAELARHNLLEAVDTSVFCSDVGYRKPHRAPFERALHLLGIQAGDALFVGDDPHWDLLGAEQAGIRPLLLTPNGSEAAHRNIATARNLREVLDHITAQV
jgi:HAD superfamily hydrolase (TIGR01509 family)